MSKEVLIIKSDIDDFEMYYLEGMKNRSVDVVSVYTARRTLPRLIQNVHLRIIRLGASMWYAPWKQSLKQYKTIIVFDRITSFDILKYIHKKNPDCRLIFWYWNTVKKLVPDNYRKFCEIWSFDQKDCEKYNLKKNVQFYIPQKIVYTEPIYDAFFVGRDKGREEALRQLERTLCNAGYRTKFMIVQDKGKRYEKDSLTIKKILPYQDILEYIKGSRCIVDIAAEGQSGMTVRILEAVFYGKKLITNHQDVMNTGMYHENNIYILDHSKYSLEEFAALSPVPYDPEILQQYSYEAWLYNFGRIQ